MQTWAETLKDYDRSLANVECRIAELQEKIKTVPKNTSEWHSISRRIVLFETEQMELIADMQEMRDRG